MVRQTTVHWILVSDGPTHTTHLPNAHEVGLPNIVTAKTRFGCLGKLRRSSRVACATTRLQIVEVVLMQHHAVVFETKSPGEFGICRHLFLIHISVFDECADLLG